MEKLELKHLAPYLPYGLKILYQGDVCELEGLSIDLSISVLTDEGDEYSTIKYIKPILKPLSDLTKEIEHNGEKFVPTKVLSVWDLEGITINDIKHIPVNLYELLLEWHFDVFGLIEKGLAINKNEI